MTDRELLELAAKAAGMTRLRIFDGVRHAEDMGNDPIPIRIEAYKPDGSYEFRWNSLTNDADAFRLMVALKMEVEVNNGVVMAQNGEIMEWPQENGEDMNSATRRAITRAAAEIQLAKDQSCKN